MLKPCRKPCWRSIAADGGNPCCCVSGAVAAIAGICIMGLPAAALCLLYLSSISLRRRLLFLPALMTRRRRWVGGWKYLQIDLSDGTLELNLAYVVWCDWYWFPNNPPLALPGGAASFLPITSTLVDAMAEYEILARHHVTIT